MSRLDQPTWTGPAGAAHLITSSETYRDSQMAAATTRAQCLLGFRRRAPLPFPFPFPFPIPRAPARRRGVRMASSDGPAPFSTAVAVPGAAGPVRVVAAPGLPEADFRNAIESALFKQWLKNLQTEKGVLTYGRLNLRQILIQVLSLPPPSPTSKCFSF